MIQINRLPLEGEVPRQNRAWRHQLECRRSGPRAPVVLEPLSLEH
jgi:hypothetical protein